MPKKYFCLAALLSGLLCASFPLHAKADDYNVGFRTMGYVNQQTGARLDVNVWYPAKRKAKTLRFQPWEIRGAHFAAPLPNVSFPLVVFSHPSAGNRFSFHDTAYALAQKGFVVAAPTHQFDNMDNMPQLYTWEQVAGRAKEISALVDLLQKDPDFKSAFDPKRIGIVGFGTGGTAALMLGGAQQDCSDWERYCMTEDDSYYCNAWAKLRINEQFCSGLSRRPLHADPRFKAAVLVSPNYGMLFTRASLRSHRGQVLFVLTSDDRGNPPELLKALTDMFPKNPQVLEIEDSSPVNFLAICPESLAPELPEICRPNTEEIHYRVRSVFAKEIASFFLKHLGDGTERTSAPADIASGPLPPPPSYKPGSAPQKRPYTRRLRLSAPPDTAFLR